MTREFRLTEGSDVRSEVRSVVAYISPFDLNERPIAIKKRPAAPVVLLGGSLRHG